MISMLLNSNLPQITMELFETDKDTLQEFILTKELEDEFTEQCLILYDFAMDCKHAGEIQPDLLKFLLPFYFKAIQQAALNESKVAIEIYFEFNLALFKNQENVKQAIGEKEYQWVMDYYIEQTLTKMETETPAMLEWVSIFNTTIALEDNNIRKLFSKIFQGSKSVKYAFFQLLSVLLFKESDNLLAVNETKAFWSSEVWEFDDGYVANVLFWSDSVVDFFDKTINKGQIEKVYNDIEPYMRNMYEPELVDLLQEEMHQSFATGNFLDRKKEYSKKIAKREGGYTYWDDVL